MTPCSGQSNFRPCLNCARFRPVAIMRPVQRLTVCAFYTPKPALVKKGKHGVTLIAYAGKEA